MEHEEAYLKTSPDYSAIAKTYDRRFEVNDFVDVEKLVPGFVGSDSSMAVLEVGCGTGHWLSLLSPRVQSLAGVDLSQEMLDRARPKLPPCRLARGRAEDLPWADDSFDRIFCVNAFHHFTDKRRATEEACRVLRPGGGLLIIGMDPHNGIDRWWVRDYFASSLDIDKGRYLSTEAIRSLMSECGLSGCRTVVALHSPVCFSARAALEEGRLAKTTMSQLALLSDAEYEEGMARLRRDIQASEAASAEKVLLSDLRVYATTGWLQSE